MPSLTLSSLVPIVRHGKVWKIKLAGLEVSASSRVEALEELKQALEGQTAYGHTRIYKFTPSGAVFVLYYLQGWRYDITSPNHAYPSTTSLGCVSQQEALNKMEQHCATYEV